MDRPDQPRRARARSVLRRRALIAIALAAAVDPAVASARAGGVETGPCGTCHGGATRTTTALVTTSTERARVGEPIAIEIRIVRADPVLHELCGFAIESSAAGLDEPPPDLVRWTPTRVSHASPRSDGRFEVSFTPTTAGMVELSVWANAVDGNLMNTGDAPALEPVRVALVVEPAEPDAGVDGGRPDTGADAGDSDDASPGHDGGTAGGADGAAALGASADSGSAPPRDAGRDSRAPDPGGDWAAPRPRVGCALVGRRGSPASTVVLLVAAGAASGRRRRAPNVSVARCDP